MPRIFVTGSTDGLGSPSGARMNMLCRALGRGLGMASLLQVKYQN